MNDTAKKTHIYRVDVLPTPSSDPQRVFVRADSRAQARSFVAARLIDVERAEQDDLLGVKREDVLDARAQVAHPDQQPLLEQTAAEALEGGDGE